MKTVYTPCHICEQNCGLAVCVEDGKVTRIGPDKENRYNWRDFCIKGATSYLSLDHPARIQKPMKRAGDRYVETSYREAIADISTRLSKIIKKYGPHAVAGYCGNPAGLSFGSTVFFNMLLDAIGTRNKYSTASIDENALHQVHDKMFGGPWAPLQQDIDRCRCFLFIGTNPAISGMGWLGHAADGWKRTLAAKDAGADLIVVDPRHTESAARATLHIAPLPESDWAFLLAIIKLIFERNWQNGARFAQANGLEIVRAIADQADFGQLARRCDVPLETIERVAEIFAKSPSAMAVSRTGPGQGRNGTLAMWLTVILNLITNRIESEGGVFFASGALDLLADSDKLMPPANTISRVRGNKSVVGFLPMAELPDEINTAGEGQVRALFINGGNPVIMGPAGDELDAALAKLDLLVSVDLFQRDSHRHAHWLIPAVHFLEREELHVILHALNPVPFVQMSRQAVKPPPGMLPEWQFFRDLALAMDLPLIKGKKWLNPLIRASRWIAGLTGNMDHTFSPNVISRAMLRQGGRIKWKDVVRAEHGTGNTEAPIEYGGLFRAINMPDKKIAAAPGEFVELLKLRLQEPLHDADKARYPLQLISRRRMKMMNSWLLETAMTKMSVRDRSGDRIEMNPADCEHLGLTDGQMAIVSSATGSVSAKIRSSDAIREGVAVMEHGWGGRTYDPKHGGSQKAGGVNRNLLVSNQDLDPLSGVPRLNGVRIHVTGTAGHAT